jgi:hypothetical protein
MFSVQQIKDVGKGLVLRPWTDLRGISNSSAAKSTIFIPLLGYWIVFNESVARWLTLIHPLADSGPHVSYRLLWTYIGLTFIALGTFLYAIFCPPEVKKYRDYQDYINGDGNAMTRSTIDTMLDHLEAQGYSELRDGVTRVAREDGDADVMDVYFHYSNEGSPAARLAVTLLYYAGFGILAALSVQIFLRVLVLTFS